MKSKYSKIYKSRKEEQPMTQPKQDEIDLEKMEQFAGSVISDISAAFSGVLTSIGNKLGLYKAMAGSNEISSIELANKTLTHERYVREWLNNQVAGGYVKYHSDTEKYSLPNEHIPVLVDENNPFFLVPALEVASSLWHDEDKVINVFKTGKGIPWAEHHHRLFCGSEALFRPGYKAHLTTCWIKALDGMEEKLTTGAKVADVGCGHGASTIIMASSYPKSKFFGFDIHKSSIETAKKRASDEGIKDNIQFKEFAAKDYKENDFDLICFMDCLHDMGDPVGAAAHAKTCLKPDGKLMIVEPAAGNSVIENINPISRLYYAASTAVCTPSSLSQEVGLALGAQAGEGRLSSILKKAGFSYVKRVAETPFNMVLEAGI